MCTPENALLDFEFGNPSGQVMQMSGFSCNEIGLHTRQCIALVILLDWYGCFMWTLHSNCVYIECCIASQLAWLFIVLVLYLDRILQWWLHCNCLWVAIVLVPPIVARQFRFILSWVEFTLQPTCMVFMRHHDVLHRSTAAALIVNIKDIFDCFIILKKD